MNKLTPETPQNLVRIGGPVDRVKVSLRFFGDDLNPAEVSRLLGCEPSVSHVKGEEIVGSVTGRKRYARTGSWRLESDTDADVSMEGQINRLLGRVTGELAVWGHLAERYGADLFCGLFLKEENRGFTLSAAVLHVKVTRRSGKRRCQAS